MQNYCFKGNDVGKLWFILNGLLTDIDLSPRINNKSLEYEFSTYA